MGCKARHPDSAAPPSGGSSRRGFPSDSGPRRFSLSGGPGPARRFLCLLELGAHELQALIPEARIGEVDTDDLTQLLGAARAAGAEHLEIARDERVALVDVPRVDRQRQQLAVRVRVDVTGRRDEVGDVGPPGGVAVGDLYRVAEQLDLAVLPQLADPLGGQLAL